MAAQVQSRTCTSGDVTVEYFLHGRGDPILILPGASLSCDYLFSLAEALADVGYCAVRVNLRGAGKSTGPAGHVRMQTYADDMRLLIDHLGLGPVDLAGHAFGNRVARATAHFFPDRSKSVILLAAGGAVAPKPEASAALQVILAPDATHDAVIQAMRFMVGDPKDVDMAWAAVGPSRAPGVSAMQNQALAESGLDWLGEPDHWPWLVVQGTRDQIAPAANGEQLKARYGDKVTLVSIEGAGHLMAVTRPEQTTRAIVDFLRQR